jgi:hypothetical protein
MPNGAYAARLEARIKPAVLGTTLLNDQERGELFDALAVHGYRWVVERGKGP